MKVFKVKRKTSRERHERRSTLRRLSIHIENSTYTVTINIILNGYKSINRFCERKVQREADFDCKLFRAGSKTSRFLHKNLFS